MTLLQIIYERNISPRLNLAVWRRPRVAGLEDGKGGVVVALVPTVTVRLR